MKFKKILAATSAAMLLACTTAVAVSANDEEVYDGNPSFQYYGNGVFHLYAAHDAMMDMNGTAGGTTAFLFQMPKQKVIDNDGYAISFIFTTVDGEEKSWAVTGNAIPDYDIEPDPAMTGVAGGWLAEDLTVLPVPVRQVLEEAGVSANEVEELTVAVTDATVEYIKIGTYAPEKKSPPTGVADVAIIAAGLAIVAGGTCLIVTRKQK